MFVKSVFSAYCVTLRFIPQKAATNRLTHACFAIFILFDSTLSGIFRLFPLPNAYTAKNGIRRDEPSLLSAMIPAVRRSLTS